MKVNDPTILEVTLVSAGSSQSLLNPNTGPSLHLSSTCVLLLAPLSYFPHRDFTPIFLWEAEGQWAVVCTHLRAEQGR